ncbi:sulfatase-like hydrolase/transferase [Mariniblastus fucicola]|uniref:Arylsulfatase n=1 Tax=Mariniblastus fucicola TaxID=980251 RepID=A0A5B9PRM8_9BACT|nr:sulfatase-like hydrolase/transferase [Mariniblastus fucicola]QEG25171.1 Arylsulfatase [Mariniblastus fucicola]
MAHFRIRPTVAIVVGIAIAILVSVSALQVHAQQENTDWPGFRGTGAVGVANGFETALEWDVTNPDDKSILWKSPVPGLGHSCPTIVGNRIFVATAVAEDGEAKLQFGRAGNIDAADDDSEQSWMVLCFDKTTGKELWRKTAHTGIPKATRHTKATHANTTVAVDGDNVVAFFGSEGLYCYDLEGNLKWKKDLGVVDVSKYGTGWGYGSSPAIHDGHIVLVCDDPEHPYVVALKLADGEEVWRKTRDKDCERSWGTPLIHSADDGAKVVVNGWPWIISYDLATGDEVWRVKGGGDNPIPTPFVVDEHIFITNAHGGRSPIIAVRTDAKGNLDETESPDDAGLAWRTEKGGSYMSTPVVVGEHMYLGNTNGVLRCFNVKSGEKVYEKRIASGAYIVSSLVAANDKIYCTAEDGTVYVIKAGPEYEVLARNRLGAPCLATPAISAGVLFFRTAYSLIAIGPNSDAETAEETDVTKKAKKPNILFIAVDDLRPSLGCYGDEVAVSPNIDALSARGMTFNRAYCQVAVCNPSRASLMTGLSPDSLGVWTLPIHFREAKPDAVTIPQWFRKSGYAAASHGKIYHNPTPDPQSWSEPIRRLPKLPYPYPEGTRELVNEAMEKLPQKDWRKNNLRRPSTSAPDLPDNQVLDGARTDQCIEDLKRLGKSSQPFMLAMGYVRPHLAFIAPKKYWDMYDPEQLPVPVDQHTPIGAPQYSMHNNSELSHYVDLIDMPKPWDDETLPPEKMRQLIHGYYACVSYVDSQIGRLLKTLDEEGLRENTIVVLWSDHGWKLGEYRGWGKMTNYEIDARVPMIISAPGMKTAGESTDSLAELIDIYPTLCELAGIEVPDFVEGKSLAPVLQDSKARVRESAVSQYYRKHQGREYMGYSMRTDQYRYIEWRDFGTGELVEQELYDHYENEMETENLIASVSPGAVEGLSALLKSTHPPKKLELVPAIHTSPSGAGRLAADISFENETDVEITVYPIVSSGKRNRGKKIAPGKSLNLKGRIGGAYVVESADGTIHEVHSPCWPPRPVVIRK